MQQCHHHYFGYGPHLPSIYDALQNFSTPFQLVPLLIRDHARAMQFLVKTLILPLLLVTSSLATGPGFNLGIGNLQVVGGVNRCTWSSLILYRQLIRCREYLQR